jgi:hypothetical protein
MLTRYPKRSWGINASLPWLISTMTIIGVAMIEELDMREKAGEAYQVYREKTPFLFPIPEFLKKVFAFPFHLFFRKDRPDRKREVAIVIVAYTLALIGASAFFYGNGLSRMVETFTPSDRQSARIGKLATELRTNPNRRQRYFLAQRLAKFGEPATDHFIQMLKDEDTGIRVLAAEYLGEIASQESVPALIEALHDTSGDVRARASESLAEMGSFEAAGPMIDLLDDQEDWIRTVAARSLAKLGAGEAIPKITEELINSDDRWMKIAYIESLGVLRATEALPAIIDAFGNGNAHVRRSAVIAMMEIGSTDVIETLRRAADDSDWEVRVYAREALKRIRVED